jgi:hypothetical protein
MSEVLYISKCLRQIEQKVNRGSSEYWTYEDYKKIQKVIFEASSINLSTHTLERLYGKLKTHKNYKPQAETKNALAIFLGFTDWDDFKDQNVLSYQELAEDPDEDLGTERTELSNTGKKQNFRKIYFLLLFFCIAIATGVIVFLHKSAISTVDFKAVNVFGTAPHTVKFLYDLTDLEGDDFSIYFPEYGDTVKLIKTQTFTYRPFLQPGQYVAYLLSDKKIISRADIYIETQGWTGDYYTQHLKGPGIRTKIPHELLRSEGRLYTPYSLLPDSVKKIGYYFLSYLNIRDYGVDGDNVSFETRFRNQARPGNSVCYDMWFGLMGTEGVLKMHFLVSGCFGYVDMTFGDKSLKGTNQDLSPFSIDLKSWKKARLEVIDKNVRIYLGDSLIYKTKYSKSVGNIVGIEVTSKTSGETDYVKLYDAKRKLLYEDDFGGKPGN